jgi:lipopolysaccharide transport system ATP-binding protein
MICFLATSHPLPATASLCEAWPDAGSITMRGRVGALIALGAGFNPILTGREPKGWEARRKSNRRLDRREGANQNIYINGSVLGLTKTD